jgi:predicted permease
MRTLIGDLRYAFRTLRKSPGFTLIAILSLALGIGANTAIFSFVDAVALRPLPVKDSGSIVAVHATAPGARLASISYPDYVDLRDQTRTLQSVVGFGSFLGAVSVNRDAVPQMALNYLVTWNFFSGLGIEIPVGRGFREDEDRTDGKDRVAIISHPFWERAFNSDPNVAGRFIRVNGKEFTVVGVVSQDFSGPESVVMPDVYVPFHSYRDAAPMVTEAEFLTSRKLRPVNIFARLKPGIGIKTAQAEMATIAQSLAAQYPDSNKERTFTVLTYKQDRYENDTVDAILGATLMGITGLVLLIACANVANLLLARGTARVKEIAIRMAIGAGRGVLIRQLLTESMLLALMGGAAGVGVGYAGVRFLAGIPLPADFPLDLGIRMDGRLLMFSLALSAVTGIVFGLLPALRATRMDLNTTMKASDQGPAGRPGLWKGRLAGRNILVTVQLTLSVVLLVASGLFVRGFTAARKMDPGFRLDLNLMVSFNGSLIRYDEAKSRLFYKALIDRVRMLPGVKDATMAASFPFSTNQFTRSLVVDGYQPRAGEDKPYAFANFVDDHYFGLMETKILRGRAIDSRDTATSPRVAMINDTVAKKLFPNRDALGAQMRLDSATGPVVQIVGIVKTGTYLYWSEPPTPFIWMPFTQDYNPHVTMHVLTAGNPAAMAGAIREAVRTIDPEMPVFSVRSMEAFYDARAMLGPRVTMQMVTTVGLMGLLLAVIGLYGVVAYAVSRRTREIGIRMAIGANPGDVSRMILGQGLVFTAIGVGGGLAIAFFASRVVTTFVVGVSPHDPAIFLSVPIVLAAVMIAACWLPARRASRIDPTLALRQE